MDLDSSDNLDPFSIFVNANENSEIFDLNWYDNYLKWQKDQTIELDEPLQIIEFITHKISILDELDSSGANALCIGCITEGIIYTYLLDWPWNTPSNNLLTQLSLDRKLIDPEFNQYFGNLLIRIESEQRLVNSGVEIENINSIWKIICMQIFNSNLDLYYKWKTMFEEIVYGYVNKNQL